MTADHNFKKRLDVLRRKAEASLSLVGKESDDRMDPRTKRLLHDLHVHQIELEMQNEELLEAQRIAEKSRDQYLDLFHHAPVGYIVADASAMILMTNRTFSQMVSRDVSALLHTPLSRLIHEEDRKQFFLRYKAFYRQPEGKFLETRLRKENRRYMHARIEGRRMDRTKPGAGKEGVSEPLFITISDVTQQKMAEHSIISAKRQWEQTFDTVPDLIAIIDESSRIVRVNQALAKRLGVKPNDCVGRTCHEIFHDKVVDSYRCAHRDFFDAREIIRFEAYNPKFNGHFITTISPFHNEEQAPGWCIHIDHEITDRKRAEKELLKLRNLESIGILAGGIAHDFNNILTVLVGNVEMAEICYNDEGKCKKMMSKALEAAFKAKDLANRLLTFSTGGHPKRKPVQVDRLLEEVVDLSLSGTNIRYGIKRFHQIEPVVIDETQIKSALQNIIANAKESMPWGGNLRITIGEHEIKQPKTDVLKAGKCIAIDICDEGHGIHSDHLNKIFDPYFTTKQMGAQKGMGLGLAISHSIIKKHKGHIEVESDQGKGTTVRIFLPLSSPEALAAGSRVFPEKKGTANQRLKLLVMDDEKMIWNVLKQMLQHIECDADFVLDGEAALEQYTRSLNSEAPYDALLLDLTIKGGMGAKEVIAKILSIDPYAKAAVFSGYSSDPEIVEYDRFGFIGALKKPFSIEQLEAFVELVLKGKTRSMPLN